MEIMTSSAINYLDEYRRRYGPLSKTQLQTHKSRADVNELLARYLGKSNAEHLVTDSTSASTRLQLNLSESEVFTSPITADEKTTTECTANAKTTSQVNNEDQFSHGKDYCLSICESDDDHTVLVAHNGSLLETSTCEELHSTVVAATVTNDAVLTESECSGDVKRSTDSANGNDESQSESESSCDSDSFDHTALLATSALKDFEPITVDEVFRKDVKLNEMRAKFSQNRRWTTPVIGEDLVSKLNSDEKTKGTGIGIQKQSQSFKCMANTKAAEFLPQKGGVQHHSRYTKSLGRTDSSISNRSAESNTSSWSYRSDLLEFSDDESAFDFEIDLNSSMQSQSDTDSQKLFAQFHLDSDSKSDVENVTSDTNLQGCANCEPKLSKTDYERASIASDFLCQLCSKRRTERRETLQELLSSEINYYNDLLLIKEQFHDVLLDTGLLTLEEVSAVFGNLLQLVTVSQKFSDQLAKHLQDLTEKDDEHFCNAMVGQIICESSAMFLAFETYCLHYNNAIATIEQLRKDKQLFHFFLEASQKDNTLLRRMDLKTFLMLPVQRIMKYPLLLKRLHKVTHTKHTDRKPIAQAVEKLTNILHHINTQSKLLTSMFVPAKDANLSNKKRTSFEIALTKLSLDAVGWTHDEIQFLVGGKIGYLQPTDSNWTEKIKMLRLNIAYAIVISKGRDTLPKPKRNLLFTNFLSSVSEAALLLIKKGHSRLQTLREPLYLNNCIITRNAEFHDVFEIQENIKETLIIRPVASSDKWFWTLKYYSMLLGGRNQRRKNALPNILLNTL